MRQYGMKETIDRCTIYGKDTVSWKEGITVLNGIIQRQDGECREKASV